MGMGMGDGVRRGRKEKEGNGTEVEGRMGREKNVVFRVDLNNSS